MGREIPVSKFDCLNLGLPERQWVRTAPMNPGTDGNADSALIEEGTLLRWEITYYFTLPRLRVRSSDRQRRTRALGCEE